MWPNCRFKALCKHAAHLSNYHAFHIQVCGTKSSISLLVKLTAVVIRGFKSLNIRFIAITRETGSRDRQHPWKEFRPKYLKQKESQYSCGIMEGSGIHGSLTFPQKKLHGNCFATCAADKSDKANNDS